MNRKQLIVAWVMGILLSIVAYIADYSLQGGGVETLTDTYPVFVFEDLFRYGLPIMIIGSLLIYTLRDKKK